MWLLYDLVIQLYGGAISAASLFNKKAKKWVEGRQDVFQVIESAVGSRQSAVGSRQSAVGSLHNVAWFHCASLGEFEQGRPVIEAFHESHPDWKIVLTFFSPSGYEVRKNYPGADLILYLPLDTPVNVRQFLELINPSLVFFVKYEYWFRYLDALYQRKIPVYVISAIFRPDQHFFKWYGDWALSQLKKVTGFFVQDEESAALLSANGIAQVVVSGDTRFDRVASIADHAKSFPLIEEFAEGKPVFLAGSTWPADEELIMKLIYETGDRMKFIIAPHEVGKERVEELRSSVVSRQSLVDGRESLVVSLFSQLDELKALKSQVIIVDGIGYLSHLYQYATVAYIGGGFGVGIHNILEAATFGKPVIFGPKYQKFREARELIADGGAFSISNEKQLIKNAIRLVTFPELLKKASRTSAEYVQRKKGATEIILSNISTR